MNRIRPRRSVQNNITNGGPRSRWDDDGSGGGGDDDDDGMEDKSEE